MAAEGRALWTRCINAAYLTSVEDRGSQKCPHCDYSRRCHNHFCLLCTEGGLCPMQFRHSNQHRHHPWLQVRSVTRQLVINANELEHYLGDRAHKIQMYRGNEALIYNLKTKERTGKGKAALRPTDIICGGCDTAISRTTTSTAGVEVCSIECLVKQADRQRQPQLLALRAGVDLREPYVAPMTAHEKITNNDEARVPMPARLLVAPVCHHTNVIDAGGVVVKEETVENGDGGAQDMEMENHAAVEPEVVYDYGGVVVDGLWPDLVLLTAISEEEATARRLG